MQLSFSSILSHQSQLCNNTAQAMSCCPYHTGDKQWALRPPAHFPSHTPSDACHDTQGSCHKEAFLPMMGTPVPRAFHLCAATELCVQVKLESLCPVFRAPTCHTQSLPLFCWARQQETFSC